QLGARVLEEEQSEGLLLRFEERVERQREGGPMVPMGVDRPPREDDVGLLFLERLAELVVARRADLRRAVDLAQEARPRRQDLASLAGFRLAEGACLVLGFPLHADLAAGQI